MARYKKKRALLTPDLTPLIDVVFLLLIFFIVSTTFNRYGNMNIELPSSTMESTVEQNENNNIEIIIDKNGHYFINIGDNKNVEVTFDEIDNYLRDAKSVSITGDKELKYQSIIDVITKVKNYGIENLGINFYE